jgi:hypothetical protein
VEPRDHDCRDFAFCHNIEDPCPAADVLAGAVPAHDPPVLHFFDICDRCDVVAHGITEGDAFDLVNGTDAIEVRDGKLLCCLARDPELTIFTGKPHRGGAVVNADEHTSNPIGLVTY